MTTTLEEPVAGVTGTSAEQLRSTCAAVRLSFTWFGTRKSLTRAQKEQAADTFGAAGEFLSAGKKLIDTRHPSFQAVTAVKNRAVSYWKSVSLPYPEAGIRLIRQDRVEPFDNQLNEFQQQLHEAVETLEEHYHELQTAARQRLGSLYNPADYPESLSGLFAIEWEFPSVEPLPI